MYYISITMAKIHLGSHEARSLLVQEYHIYQGAQQDQIPNSHNFNNIKKIKSKNPKPKLQT